jgi:hypothetical protein
MKEYEKQIQEQYEKDEDSIKFCPYCRKKLELSIAQMKEWLETEMIGEINCCHTFYWGEN